jgi:hypothetical protein
MLHALACTHDLEQRTDLRPVAEPREICLKQPFGCERPAGGAERAAAQLLVAEGKARPVKPDEHRPKIGKPLRRLVTVLGCRERLDPALGKSPFHP